MWQVRGPGFGFGFGLVTQQAVCGELGDHGLDFCHSLGQLWVRWSGLGFCGMSISRFWLNLVHEVGWFGFLETHEAWIFFFVWFNQLKGGMEPFLYALGKRDFD